MSTTLSSSSAIRVNTSFSTQLSGLQLAWDSTSLGALKECPRKYEYSIVRGFAPRAESVHLTFGRVYHSALETYDHAKSAGHDHASAQRMAVRTALELTWYPPGRPWPSDDQHKNRETLLRTVVWYLEEFKEDSLETVQLANGKAAVELSFRFSLGGAPTGEEYLLCGHLDRMVTLQGEPFILDRKTTKTTISQNFFEKFSPDNQFSLYTIAGKVVYAQPVKGLIIDAAQIAVTFSRFQRGLTIRHPAVLEEWMQDLQMYLAHALIYAEQNYWPQNDKSCGSYGGCPFRPVCSKPETVREQWLQSGYHTRIWDPLISREV